MSIDTEIKGDPASITATASHLSGSLRSSVDSTASAFASASRSPGWEGASAASFSTWATGASQLTGEITTAITAAASALTSYATDLRKAQREMQRICSEAGEAELDVAGHVIADPGAGPAEPGPLPSGPRGTKLSAATCARHADAVAAYEKHQEKVKAYRKAGREAQEVRSEHQAAGSDLDAAYSGLKGAGWFFAGVDLAVGSVAGYAGEKVKAYRDMRAERLESSRDAVRNAGYDSTDGQHRQVETDKARVSLEEERLRGISRNALRGAAGLNAISSIYDITQGKDPAEAIAAGAGGFAGGVAAGAAAGMFFGPPGALIGGTLGGIIGSGTAEGIVKDGLKGLDDGVKAAWDTGGAVVDVAGKGLEKAGGVVKDVGGALNPFD